MTTLQQQLDDHVEWLLHGGRLGKRFDGHKSTCLRWAYLKGVDLRGANLWAADLTNTWFRGPRGMLYGSPMPEGAGPFRPLFGSVS